MTAGWGQLNWGFGPWGTAGGSIGPLAVSAVVPAQGADLAPGDSIEFYVASSALLAQLVITVEHDAGGGTAELAFDGSGLAYPYRNGVSSVTTITGGLHVVLGRTGGWLGSSIAVRVLAVDTGGTALASIYTWDVVRPEASDVFVAARASAFDPYGRGVVTPLRFAGSGDLLQASGPDVVTADLRVLLMTSRGELPWRPDFGTDLELVRHRQNTAAVGELARLSVAAAVAAYEPRAKVEAVTVDAVDARLLVRLDYSVAGQGAGTLDVTA